MSEMGGWWILGSSNTLPVGGLGLLPGGISLLPALFSRFVLVFSRLLPVVLQGLLCCCVHVVFLFPACLCELVKKALEL